MIFTGLIVTFVKYLSFKFPDDACDRKDVMAIFPCRLVKMTPLNFTLYGASFRYPNDFYRVNGALSKKLNF